MSNTIEEYRKNAAEQMIGFYTQVLNGGIPQIYDEVTGNWYDSAYGPNIGSKMEIWRVRHPKKELWVSEDMDYIATSQKQAEDLAQSLKMKFTRYVEQVEHADEDLILEPVEEYNGVLIHQDPSGDLYFFYATGEARLYESTQSHYLKADIDFFIKKNLI